ncbi:MAG TPA: hypothetical protein VMU36_09015 [Spirochaetia bacterium]|nr:hypothetical protein [Spirochaetia bacterium]
MKRLFACAGIILASSLSFAEGSTGGDFARLVGVGSPEQVSGAIKAGGDVAAGEPRHTGL